MPISNQILANKCMKAFFGDGWGFHYQKAEQRFNDVTLALQFFVQIKFMAL